MIKSLLVVFSALAIGGAPALAQATFVNGLTLPGNALDLSNDLTSDRGRVGYFSDLYFDPNRNEWWALSDRGPGGGVLNYQTRLQRFTLDVDPSSGAISNFVIQDTIKFQDGLGQPFNGLNPLLLNGNKSVLGNSFDPEGFVIHPSTGHFLVSDEYGPSLIEFDRDGKLIRRFETPAYLVPRTSSGTDYVATRDENPIGGRQDNRGFEGLAITPDGSKAYAVFQDPLFNDVGTRDGRNSRNVRIVEFDYATGQSTGQYVYQLELQSAVRARIEADGGTATATDPRQGRNIGLSAIVALGSDGDGHQRFLVLERDNRGIGVDDPAGANVIGSKRVYEISLKDATKLIGAAAEIQLGANSLPTGVLPVPKNESTPLIDLAADTVLPNGKRAEKWEGLTIGPVLDDLSYLILVGTDNDYSVTQSGSGQQFDVYVDFTGLSLQRDIGSPNLLNGVDQGPVPNGYELIPGVLHAYKYNDNNYQAPVPGPLPVLGAAGVWGWSRQLRRRIRQTRTNEIQG
jgi:hypothetical protein